ncbi:6-bladed beta-propeller [Segetibacter sp. 3557_3]|uniref:6-bladed beta-propeller n=1 Tax=Segetibacter sp. 3557_3 TaxID=2547429 RepID=UPI001058DFC4|nr:6-bladed beta-propeller [Segetibacter sp. 3557_3]TDH29091.1 6-bladed beta-propeller [Segetibacter sp. 3557_3]
MRHFLRYSIIIALACLFNPLMGNAQIQKIYLLPKAPGTEKQSKFIDSISFTPLEIKDGIGLGSYSYMEVTNDNFLLFDYTNKTILLYDRNGKFIHQINYKKLGDGFYPNYYEDLNRISFFGNNKNYALTPKDRIQIKLDYKNPRNQKYFKQYFIDLKDTTYTIQKGTVDENNIVGAQPFYGNYYWQGEISTSELFKDSMEHEVKIYENKKLVQSYFPYNRINEPRYLYTQENVARHRTDSPHVNFITRPYCDTIYKLDRDKMKPVYHLVIPLENSVPPSLFTTPFKNKTERENFERNNGWAVRQVYNFHETPRFLFFAIRFFSNFETYVYQKQGNITYKTKSIKADSSQYNLQLLDNNTLRKGDRLYKPQKAGDLVTFFEQHKDIPVPKELDAFIKQKPHPASPVIVAFKLKTQP